MIVYLDNCCFNRLFDDRSNIKNYLEREAVLIIMQKAFDNELQIIGSDILKAEMSKIRNEEKRNNVEGLYNVLVNHSIKATYEVSQRAAQIKDTSNIRSFDSLHLASAEVGADVLLTTDMKFLKNSQRINTRIAVKNPIDFVMEVFGYDESDNENS
ncbi:MAG: PIN domain-containing protein [Firmicutes bacterium]|nr:PIN domain-containing protein [Bacillota bacterium]